MSLNCARERTAGLDSDCWLLLRATSSGLGSADRLCRCRQIQQQRSEVCALLRRLHRLYF